ncbi:dihydropteroate synthase [Ehrlichia ruminantium]|uniref:Dihydropteroate synthase n=1 Tax=Ehrlichia ruminantium TaxID=779 RepID=A0AAE6Q963_EHRRU|nr:dihydropteroate synthase [Ehrlichia ruminantium]QGR02688.1 dihydropteroate synthase [Ehrlichia ruminantium]QGR03609.1 dihydropteroate synthase [Ehrlichia ruminantium]QGR04536.1 dihydropteroate synthase [Ehrlichia ruminantium]
MNFNTKLVGILNYTPDSFSDMGKFFTVDKALKQAEHLINSGADIIDVGAESTRPTYLYTQHCNNTISQAEEWYRLQQILPQVIELAHSNNVKVSIDTRHAKTAEKALELNIDYINDVSALSDNDMIKVLQQNNLTGIIITHNLGIPLIKGKTLPEGCDPINEIILWAEECIRKLTNANISKDKIIIDPGIGFSKIAHQSLYILKNIEKLKALNYPIYVGHSRKFCLSLYKSKDQTLDNATLGVSISLFQKGIDFIRVHNVHLHSEIFNILKQIY